MSSIFFASVKFCGALIKKLSVAREFFIWIITSTPEFRLRFLILHLSE